MSAAVFCGRYALQLAKCLREVTAGRKAQSVCNIRKREVGSNKKLPAFFNSSHGQIADGGNSVFFAENVNHMIFADVGNLSKVF